MGLTQGAETCFNVRHFERVFDGGGKWRVCRGRRVNYVIRHVPKEGGGFTSQSLHRLIAQAGLEEEVDHEDGDGLNNLDNNLRCGSHAQNMANTHYPSRVNPTGFRGAYRLASGRFQGMFGKRYLGSFDTVEEAARAFDRAALFYKGEFAHRILNFPLSDYRSEILLFPAAKEIAEAA